MTGHPNPLVHVGLAVKLLGEGDKLNPYVCVLDTERVTLRLREPVPDTLRDAGIDREGERLGPKDTEGDLLGLRDPETVRVTEDDATGHPNPLVHVGLAVRLLGEGDKLNPAVLDIEAVRDPLEEPDTDFETEMAVVVGGGDMGRDSDLERDCDLERDGNLERDGVVERDCDLERDGNLEDDGVVVRDGNLERDSDLE